MLETTILFWNVGNSKPAMAQAIDGEREYDIIAIQEPWRNPNLPATTYCPRSGRYHLIYAGEGSRSALLINKKYSVSRWEAEATPDWCRIQLRTDEGETMTVHSIYSPIPHRTSTGARWQSPIHHLMTLNPPSRTILVGDFNLHHPSWDKHGRCTEGVEDLLTLSVSWDLRLLTPWGEPTRTRHRNRDSTIDHAWATQDLQVVYEGPEDYNLSDHRPQVVRVQFGASERPTPEGFNWKMMDKDRVAAEAAHLSCPARMGTPQEIDEQCDYLIKELQRIATVSTPKRKASRGRVAPWWNREVGNARGRAKAAERRWRAARSQQTWDGLQDTLRGYRKTMAEAKRESWRRALQEASSDPRRAWALAKWARQRSHLPPDPPKMPPLRPNPDSEPTAFSHPEKAEALQQRFFPESEAVLDDIQDEGPGGGITGPRFEIESGVSQDQVAGAINRTGAWKAPGRDQIPTGFLKACGEPLYAVLARITQASLQAAYFPRCFRTAKVVALRKPGKTARQLQTASGWRPIALLSTVGKVIEAIVAERITEAAERNGLLPLNQMGNRKGRSTELAIRLLTDQIRTAWAHKAVASLLQLDIKGAFDTVCHPRLLDTLRKKGFPPWVVQWTQSYLTDRSATLLFDDEESAPVPIRAGVPQGSPLSPILFLLYIASLYEALQEVPGVSVVGFADDTNIVAFAPTARENCRTLEKAWEVCERWARSRGMQFEPAKSELTHFTRKRTPPADKARLGSVELGPQTSVRFLGVWLDRKLSWKAHQQAIKRKLESQRLALTRLAASTWGFSLTKAREVYTKVIRSAMAYGATAFHKATEPGGKPQGTAKALLAEQTRCLRKVAGAYKATATRNVETEVYVPPLDLYLNGRVAHFEKRLEESGMGQLVRDSCSSVARLLRGRRRRQRRTNTEVASGYRNGADEWTQRWLAASPGETDKARVAAAIDREWHERWQRESEQSRTRRRGHPRQPADNPPSKDPLRLHRGLRKAESSLLIQMRTGKIGLRAFLFGRGVPDIATPICRCGQGRETAAHVAAYCPEENTNRRSLPFAMRTHQDFSMAVRDPEKTALLVRWFMKTQRLREYRVAQQIADGEG